MAARRIARWASLGTLVVGCDEAPQTQGSILDAVVSVGEYCAGVVVSGGQQVLLPAHCGGKVLAAFPLIGPEAILENCAEHESSDLATGTDFMVCDIAGGPPRSASRWSSIREGVPTYLLRMERTALRAISVGPMERSDSSWMFHAPSGAVCPGTSGSPLVQTQQDGSVALVGLVSARRRTQDCDLPGPAKAISIAEAMHWRHGYRHN